MPDKWEKLYLLGEDQAASNSKSEFNRSRITRLVDEGGRHRWKKYFSFWQLLISVKNFPPNSAKLGDNRH